MTPVHLGARYLRHLLGFLFFGFLNHFSAELDFLNLIRSFSRRLGLSAHGWKLLVRSAFESRHTVS